MDVLGYGLETGTMASLDLRLYVITDRKISGGRSHEEIAAAAIEGGATVVQFRDKELSGRKQVETALRLRDIARASGVTFIVNDRVDVALLSDADGVHLGQDDIPASIARKIMGNKIIGVSASTVEEALLAQQQGADYLGVGPVFPTGSKADAAPPIGLAGLAEIVRSVDIPVVAIGGISQENLVDVLETGVSGVAVISAVVAASDITQAARNLRAVIDAHSSYGTTHR